MSNLIETSPKAPPLVWGLTESTRSAGELAWFLSTFPWLSRQGRGAGRPVLVLPGLGAGDQSTAPLRHLLRSAGYRPYSWRLGIDIGPTKRIIEGLDDRLADIRRRNGGHRVSVIGQSLGGLLGRELARRNPDAIDRLISLGSPVSITDRSQSRAGLTYDLFSKWHLPEYAFDEWTKAAQPPIPATSIYSRQDGVVATSAALYPDSPLTENIRIHGSHLGMGVNPPSVYAILDRLQVPTDDWRRFEAPSRLRAYFPVPDRIAPPADTGQQRGA